MLQNTRTWSVAVTCMLVGACSAAGHSTDDGDYSTSGASSSGNAASGSSSGGSSGNLLGDAGQSDGGTSGTDPTCASASVNAELAKANLVVMYDRSGSMGNPNEGGDRTQRWDPVGSAMMDFFSGTSSTGLAASLQYFPQDVPASADTVAKIREAVCTPSKYQAPAVALQALPSSNFASSINATAPKGGTPTKPAIDGAIAFAAQTAAAKPGEKVVIVLVTDGEPGGVISTNFGLTQQELCPNNTVATVTSAAQAAFAATPSVPTYVIGIGTALTSLRSIAQAGGTTDAILVQVGNPADTKTKLTQALETIRGQSIPCELDLPKPPGGKAMDINTVNVVLTQAGVTSTLNYNKTCAGGTGWHYDDAAQPKKVVLCDTECRGAKSASSKVQITFGCATAGGVVR